ncbi:hypothetical protein I553_0338 [Mycobacterium xenopi 4042]|uniref:Uncharacterized protein n=1 Tax=Mycobacterium xenopi 4042 TaxID=1299334 RepID=X7YJM9_MYCXE|nr:hypothetical protein I553_0338 [Mycobacterium xenopi 4042]EUA19365.1 hypothetical protein I552_9108 [Mycobacterium xenopi 3993]
MPSQTVPECARRTYPRRRARADQWLTESDEGTIILTELAK